MERFHAGDWAELFALVREEGSASLVERVRRLERSDASERPGSRRGKAHDDATVVFVDL